MTMDAGHVERVTFVADQGLGYEAVRVVECIWSV